MEQLLRGIEHFLVLLAVGLPILGGVWALRQLNVSPLPDRQDRQPAFRLAIAVALVAGTFVGYVSAQLAGLRVCGLFAFCSTGPDYGFGIMLGVATGAVLFLGAMTGYATLARVRTTGALAGVVLGPLVLTGGPLLVASVAAGPLQDAVRDQEARDRAASRASAIHLSVSELDVRTTPEGMVDAVDLVLIVQSDRTVAVGPPGGSSIYPGFTLCPRRACSYPNSDAGVLYGVISEDGQWPAVLEAGSSTSLPLRFEARGGGTAPPGLWRLVIHCSDAREVFDLEMMVELSATR